jgi:acetolactate synthase-1/2/3 large subunit
MSGIGEAFLDGIPIIIVSGGVRTDVGYGYQLHEIDQIELVSSITKAAWRIEAHDQIIPTLFEAYRTAVSDVPGPVFVEIPANIQLFKKAVAGGGHFDATILPSDPDDESLDRACDLLAAAARPGIFVGWGAVDVSDTMVRIAEMLGAPVSTTLQGISAFPGNHPLHAGMGFSNAAVPAAAHAFEHVDVLLAVGTRFAEIPTGSFGCRVPAHLIHIDIDPEVIGRNFPAAVSIPSDSRIAVPALETRLKTLGLESGARRSSVESQIARDKAAYRDEWRAHASDRVNPLRFFDALRSQMDDDAIVVVDDGNHTYLTAELLEIYGPRQFISPTDFNAMGYCVPAAIGAKLANEDRQVVGIVGDGAFLMTATEILTANRERAGVPYFVFKDGELGQISQGQETAYNRKTCTILGDVDLEGFATAVGATYELIEQDAQLVDCISRALDRAGEGQSVIVDVRIDYSKRTRFTQGVVKNVLQRFPVSDRIRFVTRAGWRRVSRRNKKSS